jgi:hypothetical protein
MEYRLDNWASTPIEASLWFSLDEQPVPFLIRQLMFPDWLRDSGCSVNRLRFIDDNRFFNLFVEHEAH